MSSRHYILAVASCGTPPYPPTATTAGVSHLLADSWPTLPSHTLTGGSATHTPLSPAASPQHLPPLGCAFDYMLVSHNLIAAVTLRCRISCIVACGSRLPDVFYNVALTLTRIPHG